MKWLKLGAFVVAAALFGVVGNAVFASGEPAEPPVAFTNEEFVGKTVKALAREGDGGGLVDALTAALTQAECDKFEAFLHSLTPPADVMRELIGGRSRWMGTLRASGKDDSDPELISVMAAQAADLDALAALEP